MTDPHAMYHTGSEAVRTIMNRSIFTQLYVDDDLGTTNRATLSPPHRSTHTDQGVHQM
jgi:hypothetical protein